MRIIVDEIPKYSFECVFCRGGECMLSTSVNCRLKRGMPCDRLATVSEVLPEKKSYHGKRRPVYKCSLNGDLIEEYPSLRQAADAHGIPVSNIQAVCSYKRRTAGGYIWRYKE